MSVRSIGLPEIARVFLKIGTMSYGGPAIMGIMQAEIQEKRQWIGKEQFVEGLSLVNILPGPVATQLGKRLDIGTSLSEDRTFAGKVQTPRPVPKPVQDPRVQALLHLTPLRARKLWTHPHQQDPHRSATFCPRFAAAGLH